MKSFAALSFAGLLLAGCFDHHPDPQRPQEPPTPAALARRDAIETLASEIRLYHSEDSIIAATPGWESGHYTMQNRFFANRAAFRADLNRRLDSLRRTGTLEFVNTELSGHADTLNSKQWAGR